jgi:1,2-phenylacetyl-CoA epoxidase PaaB subunit
MLKNMAPEKQHERKERQGMSHEWPLWEIFIRSQHGLAHKHVGSLHAPDSEMAVRNARDVYTRRNEGVSIWVVKSAVVWHFRGTSAAWSCRPIRLSRSGRSACCS